METKIGTITMNKSKKILRSEVLLDNFIERDLQSAFKPLHYMQSLLICSKYSIRDNFITSNTFMYDFIGIFGFIVCRSINLYNLVILMGDWKSTEYLFNWSGLFDYASYTFGFLLNYYINIKFCDDNILMVIKIQRVIRALKITSNDLKRATIFNWFAVIIINAIIIFSIAVISYIFFPNVNFSDVVYFYFSMTYDMNMLYFTFIIKLLSMTLCAWTEDVRKSVNSYKDCYWESMFDVYMDIFTVYESVVSTCGYLVLFFAVFAISHGLMNMGVVIKLNLALAGAGIQGSIFIFITQVWFVKNIVLIAYLSVVCERFYKAIEEVPGAFMLLTKRHGRSDTQKRVCKNIERIQRTRFMKLDACGVFTVDATLPLDLISFTTTYTVVLLQFSI